MLTIFGIPKSFEGHNKIIQRNAIQSWLKLCPKCEIILFGDDEGVLETSNELGVKHIQFIEKISILVFIHGNKLLNLLKTWN